jgi:phosphatidylserine decarboxylase
MTVRTAIARLHDLEGFNFLVTNRVPRRALARFARWFSRIEQPLVCRLSIAAWRLFCDVELADAKRHQFRSLHDCFIRELRAGARTVDGDPGVLVSPCDGIVGACGVAMGDTLLQVKGSPYTLADLLHDPRLVERYRDGCYITLRLTAGMYHRFHAPYASRIVQVTHIAGDTFNVNPPTLKRIPRVFCRNERAVLDLELAAAQSIALVAVAAILVAGIRLHCLEPAVDRPGDWTIRPPGAYLAKGEEIGWFEHGSTIIVLAPRGFEICTGVLPGRVLRMGEPLLRRP